MSSIDNLAKVFLNDIAYIEKAIYTKEDIIIDLIFNHFDCCFMCNELNYVNKILELIDPNLHSLNSMISILTVTKYKADELSSRKVFVDKFIKYLHKSNQYNEELISGLV